MNERASERKLTDLKLDGDQLGLGAHIGVAGAASEKEHDDRVRHNDQARYHDHHHILHLQDIAATTRAARVANTTSSPAGWCRRIWHCRPLCQAAAPSARPGAPRSVSPHNHVNHASPQRQLLTELTLSRGCRTNNEILQCSANASYTCRGDGATTRCADCETPA